MRLRRLACSLLLLAGACAEAPRARWSEVEPPEALVEVLPRGAMLVLDGRPLGPGARTVPVVDRDRIYRLSASSDGFRPLDVAVEGTRLAGARIALVLRPDGFGDARRLDYDDPPGLTAAAALLLREGRPQAAADYAERAADLVRDAPAPHRILGSAYARLGRREEAARQLTTYLALAPDAPDAAAVEATLERVRGDAEVSGGRR